jgi:alkaline phosphatase D
VNTRRLFGPGAAALFLTACAGPDTNFHSEIPGFAERVWVGPEYYANRLQDWRIRGGRIESVEGSAAKPVRTLHLLTRSLSEDPGTVHMRVRTAPLVEGPRHEDTWSGFLLGAGGSHVDFRITALTHHWPSTDGGLIVALDGTGRIVVRDNSVNQGFVGPDPSIPVDAWPLIQPTTEEHGADLPTEAVLEARATPEADGYLLRVTVTDPESGDRLAESTYAGVPPEQLSGGVALVSHRSPDLRGPGYWFQNWELSGSKVERHDDRAFGPVMGALYTVSQGTLKMTAQLGPLGSADTPTASLEIRREGRWTEVDRGPIQPLSFTAHFRVEDWPGDEDVPYRVAYDLIGSGGTARHDFEGTIRRVPEDQETFVLAGLNCQHISGADGQWNDRHFWYPHTETAAAVAYHDPDLLFFAGDQIYEAGLEGVVREPTDVAALDYLGHWFRFVWAFREITRDRPTVTIPDDHDAYHGNIWGNAGVREPGDLTAQDRGGYRMEPEWVNAMHRTQVAHLPDRVDPEPLANGITTYHTRLEYGGLSFAILADRMWKSPPSVVVADGSVVNGWSQDPAFDAATQSDVPGAVLLGDRQERFLETWASDWSGDAWMKVVLSQTPFVDVATIPSEAMSGAVLPGAPIAQPGEYLEGDKKAADMDSNGWPPSGRDRAIRAMRKGFAFHIVGDQHLGHLTRYGVDAWNDAGHVFTLPSIANLWPRRWYPPQPGRSPMPWAPRNTGEYLDGFGNKMTVLAVANPTQVDFEPHELYQRAPGYGIVRFHRTTRRIEVEAWPRWAEADAPDPRLYPGWPITVMQEDQYDRDAAAWLPTVAVAGMTDPVIQVLDEEEQEVLYTLRIRGHRFRPRVFRPGGTYTVVVGEPGTNRLRRLSGVVPTEDETATLEVELR